MSRKVYQFKITLQDIKPPIWRQIQVPEDYTFWDLHVAIQDAMGWADCHLHQFRTIGPRPQEWEYIGLPTEDFDDEEKYLDWEEWISDWFDLNSRKSMVYEYDFGDSWEHRIELEKVCPAESGLKYPICIGGKRACPPEDCGGFPGYDNLLEVIKDHDHPDYKETIYWLGGEFDPEYFRVDEVKFDVPRKRLKKFLK